MIINMISGPRNVSTALMYSFAQHPQFEVVDEPFYGYYLKKTGIRHPGREEVLKSMSTDLSLIIKRLKPAEKNNLYIKNMAHHLIEVEDRSFLKNYRNIFLIRDPAKLISSFSKVIEKPTLHDIGVKDEWILFSELNEKNQLPLVIDSDELLKDPRKMFITVFHRLGEEFNEQILKWKAGPRKEDGVWAKYWYKNVHTSTGFAPFEEKQINLQGHLLELYEKALPYYNKLSQYSIRF